LSSPAIQLVHALSTITDARGRILVPELRPPPLSNSVRHALAACDMRPMPGDPETDPDWGEPGLSLAEKVFGWNAFEILAMTSGVPESPVNAIPPRAWARVQMRFVVGVDPNGFVPALRRHFDAHGFPMVQVAPSGDEIMHATRLDPDHPWVKWTAASIAHTAGEAPAILPNLGGSLPNDIFSELLGLPTVWVPHSYPGCSQHAPKEHLPCDLARQALRLMAGLYWDLGEPGTPR
jgi:acetylornithine deacetylase/succinyl-diaminopimelate desuccinylase-like protein